MVIIWYVMSLIAETYGSGIQEMEDKVAAIMITHRDPLGEFAFPVVSN